MSLKLRLVDDANKVHTYSSTIIAATLGAISAASPFVEAVWTGMPEEVKSLLPNSWRMGIALAIGFAVIVAARYTTVAPKNDGDAASTANGVTSIGPVISAVGGAGGESTAEASDGDASKAVK